MYAFTRNAFFLFYPFTMRVNLPDFLSKRINVLVGIWVEAIQIEDP